VSITQKLQPGRTYRFSYEAEVVASGRDYVEVKDPNNPGRGVRLLSTRKYDAEAVMPRNWPPEDGDVWVSRGTAYLVSAYALGTYRTFLTAANLANSWVGEPEIFLNSHSDMHLIYRPTR
jgi:hypothetical protein